MSTAPRLSKEQVAALQPGDVTAYLQTRGWRPLSSEHEGSGTVFQHPSFRGVELLVPSDQRLGDYAVRMAEVIVSLARVEDRTATQVLRELSLPKGFAISMRVNGRIASSDSIPLSYATSLLSGFRELLWASALEVFEPTPRKRDQDTRILKRVLDRARFGQTDRGSFVVSILVSSGPDAEEGESPESLEFEKAVNSITGLATDHLTGVLEVIATAAHRRSPDVILAGTARGVTRDHCLAVLSMIPSGPDDGLLITARSSFEERRFEFESVDHDAIARVLELPALVSPVHQLLFWETMETEGRWKQAAAAHGPVRGLPGPLPALFDPDEFGRVGRFVGTVRDVKRVKRPRKPDAVGQMVLEVPVSDTTATLRIEVTSEQFLAVCDALRDQRRVSVAGVLQRAGGRSAFVLVEPHDVQVLDEQ